MTASPALEIHVYSMDGSVSRFTQRDPVVAQHILAQVHPSKIFTQRNLILQGEEATAVFAYSAISRLDLIMEGCPDWPFHHYTLDVEEITHEEFHERYRPEQALAARSHPPQTGQTMVIFTEMVLSHGLRVFTQITAQAEEAVPLDFGIMIQQFFTLPSQHIRRKGGGVILIHPSSIMRLNIYPGPPDIPSAWPADSIYD